MEIALGAAPPAGMAGASNAWAVEGSRTSSRRPLLANDPHLWLAAPSVWHLADVSGGRVRAIGGALPGTPVIVIGHNGKVGWGLTTANVDDQDLYVERLNPDNPDQYLMPDGSWADFARRTIRIEISGEVARTETVRATRHGPVLTGEQFGADRITPDGHVTALRWTALTHEDRGMTAVVELMYAERIEDAVAAAGKVLAPAQNVTLADANGVAMVVAGAIPLRDPRSLSKGRVPSSGAQAVNDWVGFRPVADNPRAVRPDGGAVANANNRTTDEEFPHHISFDWGRPYRITRLEKELMALDFHSRDGFVALQNDSVSEMARAVLPLIARDLWWREGTPAIADDRRRRALELLAEWNGEMDRHGPEPLIFKEWVRALTRRLAADELGPLFEEFEGPQPLFVERVFADVDGAGIWCDVNKTPERETCAQAASVALDDALARLVRDYGSNIDGWRWGEEHLAVHRHTPFGYVSPFSALFNIEHETSGGDNTLLRGQTRGVGDYPFRNVHAAGLRVVYDFADLDNSLMIIATGQSGHPFSRYYDHLAEAWAQGGMIPMSMDDADARAGALGVTELRPARAK
jgi:penicillin amidase